MVPLNGGKNIGEVAPGKISGKGVYPVWKCALVEVQRPSEVGPIASKQVVQDYENQTSQSLPSCFSQSTRLSEENAFTICDYIIAMKREINLRLSYKGNAIQILSWLSVYN